MSDSKQASPLPRKLHLGSGKNFLTDSLNIDISGFWQPDIVADLGKPFPPDPEHVYETERFGPVQLRRNSFEEIKADDFLEHIPDLPTCMKSALDLLLPGGVFKISVPYELSLGAWSDPTHVRAFNERSWVYYCEWSWYFGWEEFRFQIDKLHFIPSPYGQTLKNEGKQLDELLRTPRAVDSMYVELVKVPLTDEDRQMLEQHRSRPES